MITRIFINDYARYKGKDIKELPPLDADICEIALTFDSEEELKLFVGQFPKSMKVRASFLKSYNNDGKISEEPYTQCRRMLPNDVTGIINEIGDKRMTRFYNALKNYLSHTK